MADGVTVDFSDVMRMAAQLDNVAMNAGPYVRSAMEGTSFKVKADAQASVAAGSKRWRALPVSIDYEIFSFQGFGSTSIRSDIGYNKDKKGGSSTGHKKVRPRTPGNLGNIREYGSSTVAPHLDLQKASEKNRSDFEDGLNAALANAERVLDANTSLSSSIGAVLRGRI